jgi:hypothetical protein
MSAGSQHALNACDTFMLTMDRAMLLDGFAGNICHVLLSFPHGTDVRAIIASIESRETFRQISGLRLKTPLLRTPRWIATSALPSAVKELPVEGVPELEGWIVSHSPDPRNAPPCGFVSLPRFAGGPSIVFYWHHSLCDARGGESLLKLFGSGQPASAPLFSQPVQLPLGEQLVQAGAAKCDIFSKASGTIARLKPSPLGAAQPRFHKLRLSPHETKSVDELALKLTNGIFPMALHLAASARAFARTLGELGLSSSPLFIPVPHDMRRYARAPHLLSNQVSFVFFRLGEGSEETLRDSVNAVIEQLHASVAARHPQNMLAFLGLLRWLPLRLLWRIIEKPTKGHPASMYFSDIGSSLSALPAFCGATVSKATHYPPVLSPPGLTSVWSRFGDSLEITVCYDAAALGQHGLETFLRNLRDELGISASWDNRESVST